jgi:hypothetical protein
MFVIGNGVRFTQYPSRRAYGPIETASIYRTEKSARKTIQDTKNTINRVNPHWMNRIDDESKQHQLQDEIDFWNTCQVYAVHLVLGSVATTN